MKRDNHIFWGGVRPDKNPFKKKREESIHGITDNSTKVPEAQNHDQGLYGVSATLFYTQQQKKIKNPKFTFCRE